MYYKKPTPPEKYFFIGAKESWVRVGLPKSKNYYQKNPENHTKKIQKTIPKKVQKTLPKKYRNITKKYRKHYKKPRKHCQKFRKKVQKQLTLWAVPETDTSLEVDDGISPTVP